MLRPMTDNVIVEVSKPEEKTKAGIILPGNSKGEKYQSGTVVCVGPGKFGPDGKRLPMSLKKGEKVLLNWGGTEVELDRVKFRVLREDDVIAVLDD